MKKYFFAFIFAFASAAAFSRANSVSIQIIQNNPGQEKVWVTSQLFEQSVINFYFDAGRIVSNSPIYISSNDSDENRKALRAALIENNDGGMDYLVRIELFYKSSNSSVPDIPKLANVEKVEWKVYNVGTGIELSSGSKKPGKINSSNDNEIGIERFAYAVAKDVTSSIDEN
ncbi:MAG: hypothetical protein IKO57_02960 [Treponema sp.]|nr:hypothetical protein [Treponema sp.]MBR4629391.1 hypothetical protein [Treponema sp.]MBR6913516.1 hypothetical protein [Treponema sp.]